jgi:hypothetical protein
LRANPNLLLPLLKEIAQEEPVQQNPLMRKTFGADYVSKMPAPKTPSPTTSDQLLFLHQLQH